MDLGDVDRHGALEHAVGGDLQHPCVERRLDAALDHQRVAVRHLHALHLDVGTDDQLGFLALVAASGFARRRRGRGGGAARRTDRRERRRRGHGRRGLALALRVAAPEQAVRARRVGGKGCLFAAWQFSNRGVE